MKLIAKIFCPPDADSKKMTTNYLCHLLRWLRYVPHMGRDEEEKGSHPLSPTGVSILRNVDDLGYYPKTRENYLYTNCWGKSYVLQSQAM